MEITRIESVSGSKKKKIYLNDQFAFELYKGELSRFHLKEGIEVTDEIYQRIMTEVLLKRAKLRAMHLLNISDKTETELRGKLTDNRYPEEIVDAALAYVKSFGYINDGGYVRRYILSRRDQKSRKELYFALLGKGIDKELIQAGLEELCTEDDTEEAVRALLRKKGFRKESADEKSLQKIYGYLARKGFPYDVIRKVLDTEE